MNTWTPILLAFLALIGGGGGLYSLLTLGATRRKLAADAAAVNADITTKLGGYAIQVLLEPSQRRIEELEAETSAARLRMQKRYSELETEVDILRGRVRELAAQCDDKDRTISDLNATVIALRGRRAPRPKGTEERA